MTLRKLKQMQAARRQTSYRGVTSSFEESQISPSDRVRKQALRRATNQLIAIIVGALIVAVVAVGITLLIVG